MKCTLMKAMAVSVLSCTLLIAAGINAQTIETIDGVRVVHNGKPKWSKDTKTALNLVKKIGGLDAVEDEYMLYMPTDVTEDEQGNIYVLDAGNFRIQKFDANGKFILSFGSKGEGPGEFTMPQSVLFDKNGNIVVTDQRSGLINVYDTNGKAQKSFRPPEGVSDLHVLQSGDFVSSAMSGMMRMGGGRSDLDAFQSRKAEAMPLIKVLTAEGVLLKEFGKAHEYGSGFSNQFGNRFSLATDINDNIYLSFQYQNRIEKYSSDGKLIMSVDRPLNFKVTEAQADVNISGAGDNVSIAIRAPQLNDVSRAIAVDGSNRIWVVTNRRQFKDEERAGMMVQIENETISTSVTGDSPLETNALELEVFDPDGILLLKIPLTHFVDGMRIFGDSLYIVDRLRGMQVFEYHIVDN